MTPNIYDFERLFMLTQTTNQPVRLEFASQEAANTYRYRALNWRKLDKRRWRDAFPNGDRFPGVSISMRGNIIGIGPLHQMHLLPEWQRESKEIIQVSLGGMEPLEAFPNTAPPGEAPALTEQEKFLQDLNTTLEKDREKRNDQM
jgi:hypothetical protein